MPDTLQTSEVLTEPTPTFETNLSSATIPESFEDERLDFRELHMAEGLPDEAFGELPPLENEQWELSELNKLDTKPSSFSPELPLHPAIQDELQATHHEATFFKSERLIDSIHADQEQEGVSLAILDQIQSINQLEGQSLQEYGNFLQTQDELKNDVLVAEVLNNEDLDEPTPRNQTPSDIPKETKLQEINAEKQEKSALEESIEPEKRRDEFLHQNTAYAAAGEQLESMIQDNYPTHSGKLLFVRANTAEEVLTAVSPLLESAPGNEALPNIVIETDDPATLAESAPLQQLRQLTVQPLIVPAATNNGYGWPEYLTDTLAKTNGSISLQELPQQASAETTTPVQTLETPAELPSEEQAQELISQVFPEQYVTLNSEVQIQLTAALVIELTEKKSRTSTTPSGQEKLEAPEQVESAPSGEVQTWMLTNLTPAEQLTFQIRELAHLLSCYEEMLKETGQDGAALPDLSLGREGSREDYPIKYKHAGFETMSDITKAIGEQYQTVLLTEVVMQNANHLQNLPDAIATSKTLSEELRKATVSVDIDSAQDDEMKGVWMPPYTEMEIMNEVVDGERKWEIVVKKEKPTSEQAVKTASNIEGGLIKNFYCSHSI